ncbi:MAG TPA: ChbG/HpnK family deacetylase [Terracidiphilus sp.]|nr:ChbG/HpnK family deacetylase [Terracidiphilus sp.]
MRRLIVNADDFGLTGGVNRAVEELHAAGVLTSTTLMARARATDAAIALARATPTLAVGCHVVLVDGAPVLSAHAEIPDLARANRQTGASRFRSGLPGFLRGLYLGPGRQSYCSQIEAEVRAQIEYLQDAGVAITHVDTHKHTHMFPSVLRAVLRAARACGLGAVRNPFEPSWAVRATAGAGWARIAEVSVLRWLAPVCRRIVADEGFATTDGTIAVVGTGVLDAAMVRSFLRQLPEGTWELVTHPGYNDADLDRVRTRLRASRDTERAALAAIREFPEIELISYRDLKPAPS